MKSVMCVLTKVVVVRREASTYHLYSGAWLLQTGFQGTRKNWRYPAGCGKIQSTNAAVSMAKLCGESRGVRDKRPWCLPWEPWNG